MAAMPESSAAATPNSIGFDQVGQLEQVCAEDSGNGQQEGKFHRILTTEAGEQPARNR